MPIDPAQVTWRMRVRVFDRYEPAFLEFGPVLHKLDHSLETILRYIRGLYAENKGRVALSFTRDGEEFYTLSPYWDESVEPFIEKCRERITQFCAHHQIALQLGV